MVAEPLPRGQRTATRCRAGHDISQPGAMVKTGNDRLQCRQCRLATLARYDARKKAQRLGVEVPPAAVLRNTRHQVTRAVAPGPPATFYRPRRPEGWSPKDLYDPPRSVVFSVLPSDFRRMVARALMDNTIPEGVRDVIQRAAYAKAWERSGHVLAVALFVQGLVDATADEEGDELRLDRVLGPIFSP